MEQRLQDKKIYERAGHEEPWMTEGGSTHLLRVPEGAHGANEKRTTFKTIMAENAPKLV